ncbi:MAG TPA: SDR family oxidoreductase [Hypericibacter adhaerens]|jgi:NAD(P)-dependent dehydrogenase (short-subunit alcohol dehydrogenase family)|uniref:3-ketoacyl-ACP reductase n=1 Tax=Hypericibacter adhaerens TaxID=2602016 RepID=A0A5J6N2S3_9PROT|nr:SDR family oxidoreductase [Hypericibacter adhaerens]QEX23614.1 3-ketoacyl-ACP reductase [Hypericibacter adhaerens]HWA41650.1 SDR family oxidoreductase [Hypericibacter adhaerens]
MTFERFDNQVAVVTGAAQGLGAAISQLFVSRGAFVHLLDLDRERLQATTAKLGPQARAHVADVTREADILATRDAILAQSGRCDILVNNAGIYPFEGTMEITEASWDRMFDTNLKSVFFTTRAFMGAMAAQNYGRVVCISSTDSYIPKPLYPHYAASKAAIRSLVKTFALELAGKGVLVNGVSPGSIATERAREQGWLPRAIQRIPVGRAATPEQIAEVVAFLASQRNQFMTGETVVASGGEIMV